MVDTTETKQISITLPAKWVEIIDSKTTDIKTRQDIIREVLEPYVKKTQKEMEANKQNA